VNVSDIMTRKVITVPPDYSVERAVQLFQQRGIRHLPVLDGSQLVGIVSERDLVRALEPLRAKKKKLLNVGGLFFLLEPLEVKEIMSKDVISVPPDVSVQYAAASMVVSRLGALPVVADGKLVGIVTDTDLLRYLASEESKPAPAGAKPRGAKTTREHKRRSARQP